MVYAMGTFLTLNLTGLLLAVLMGSLLIFFAGSRAQLFLGSAILFLVLSYIVTDIDKAKKESMKLYQEQRTWKNVVANGVVPVFVAFLYYMHTKSSHSTVLVYTITLAYMSSIAAITADKFASELGVLSNAPRMLIGFKKVKIGTSGAVSGFGLFWSLIGAAMIGLFFGLSYGIGTTPGFDMFGFIVITISGFVGNIFDSLLGYFEEKGFGNKYTSNAMCSAVGAVCAVVIFPFI